jgi:Putative adhesin
MKNIRFHSSLLVACALALAPAGFAHGDQAVSTISFSDPSKPGTLKVRVWHGDVTVHGADVKEITVKSDSEDAAPTPRKDGMRVLSTSSSYALSEKNNVATLEFGSDGWSGGSADFDIVVPRSTSVIVANSVHGDLDCSDLTGDIEVRSMHGDVKLEDVSGGALVETVSGEIKVDVKSLAPSRPLSFTSMNGEITIHVPADLKAGIRFRTHRGVILTNFDDKALVTKTEVSRRMRKDDRIAPVAPVAPAPPANADAASQAQPAPKAKGESEDDWKGDVRDQVREAALEAVDAAKEAAEAAREGLAEANIQISRTFDTLPPMTGGKTVSGSLNGGGVEIQAATLNGDIILKKAE